MLNFKQWLEDAGEVRYNHLRLDVKPLRQIENMKREKNGKLSKTVKYNGK